MFNRNAIFTALFAAMFILASNPVAGAREIKREVRDPHYGEVLFYFYQQKYFSSITRLLTSRQQQRLPHHDEESELLLGGMYLSYGLHREAGRIFKRLIDAAAEPAIRDRAWFYVGKIRYQRGYHAEAAEALARIKGSLPGSMESERQILLANLMIAQGRYDEAVELLSRVRGRDGWGAYGQYNLGVALIKAGRKEKGLKLLETVGGIKARDEEMKSLRDKANVALGFTYMQEGAPAKAKTRLERVRLSGLMSNKALLGIGWSYSAREKHHESLTPWMELFQRNAIDPAVQESLLAVPYALGKLGALNQSLRQYEAAIVVYNKEMQRLDKSIGAIRAGRMTANILRQDPDREMGWFWRMQALPDADESRYLIHLMASHGFQEAMKNYRDTRQLLSNLEAWAENTAVFDDMIDARRVAYQERLPRVRRHQGAENLKRMRLRRDQLAGELARTERDQDALALATAREQAWLRKLDSVRQRLDRSKNTEDTQATREKARLLRGILFWNISTDYKPRLWRVKKGLQELDQAIAEAETRGRSLEQAKQVAAGGFEGYSERVAGLRSRIRTLQQRLHAAAGDHERFIERLAVAELERQQQRLAIYLTQARFAVAQIYDQAQDRRGETP